MKKIIINLFSLCLVACSATAGWATVYDLSSRGTSYAIGSTGAVATEYTLAMQTTQSSGTGVINPFLTIQANGTENGVNTDTGANLLPFDDKRPEWTNAITLGDLKASNYTFALDINEAASGTKPIINLDQFKIWVLPAAVGGSVVTKNNATTYAALASLLASNGATQVFDLGNNSIKLHYDLWSGSGQNLDMQLSVPSGNFAGKSLGDYLYVWAQFSSADAGFEEWCLIPTKENTPVPEPGTMALLGLGMAGLAVYGKRRQNNKA